MNGLFYTEPQNKRCTCEERNKPISSRDYVYYAYFCHNPWGKAKYKYDNRKLLRILCNKCGATWVEYNPRSKYWDVINDTPYTEGELVKSAKKKTLISSIKEWWYGFSSKTKTKNNK